MKHDPTLPSAVGSPPELRLKKLIEIERSYVQEEMAYLKLVMRELDDCGIKYHVIRGVLKIPLGANSEPILIRVTPGGLYEWGLACIGNGRKMRFRQLLEDIAQFLTKVAK